MNKDLTGTTKHRFFSIVRFVCIGSLAFGALNMAVADPILPYANPIAEQLAVDIATLEANPDRTPADNQQLRDSRAALEAFERTSTSLPGDVAILRNLNTTLPIAYETLLTGVVTEYVGDFHARRQDFESQLASTPRSAARRLATTQLRSISNILSRIEEPATTARNLDHLGSAARRLVTVSNVVRRATLARTMPSSMTARIGRLLFNSTRRSTIGFLTNGVLNVAAFHVAELGRGIQIYLTGVTAETPATYPLSGDNFATYTAMAPNNRVFVFQSVPGPAENPSAVTIDAITPRFLIGRFNFTAEIQGPVASGDTNTITTITNGEFQLNFY